MFKKSLHSIRFHNWNPAGAIIILKNSGILQTCCLGNNSPSSLKCILNYDFIYCLVHRKCLIWISWYQHYFLPGHETNLQREHRNTKGHDKNDGKQKNVKNGRKFKTLWPSEFCVLTGIAGFQAGRENATLFTSWPCYVDNKLIAVDRPNFIKLKFLGGEVCHNPQKEWNRVNMKWHAWIIYLKQSEGIPAPYLFCGSTWNSNKCYNGPKRVFSVFMTFHIISEISCHSSGLTFHIHNEITSMKTWARHQALGTEHQAS